MPVSRPPATSGPCQSGTTQWVGIGSPRQKSTTCPCKRLRDHLRDELERAWNTRAKAEVLEMGSSRFVVQFGVGHQVAWRGRTPKSRDQGLGSLLKNLCVRGIAIPTFAHQWHATVL